MARDERYFERPSEYSVWHRARSINRFLAHLNRDKHRVRLAKTESYIEYSDPRKNSLAHSLGTVDIDHVLIDGKHYTDRAPIALIESARTFSDSPNNQKDKAATILTMIGKRAQLPVYVVQYFLSNEPNPAEPRVKDIAAFFVQMRWPERQRSWTMMTPTEYAAFLVSLRVKKPIGPFQQVIDPQWLYLEERDVPKAPYLDAD